MIFTADTLLVSSAIAVGAILGLLPFAKYEFDDPVGVSQYARYRSGQKYDYIVVGGGTTGSVIASRLSENPQIRVLLLEAGGDGSFISNIPGAVGVTLGSQMDWKYQNEPDGRSCLAMNQGRCNWHRGKALGGSSTLNGMLYVRGDKDDYDNWERLGNPGWGWRDVLPYFQKLENQRDPRLANKGNVYGTRGPLAIETPDFFSESAATFLHAATRLGYSVRDINDGNATGFSHVQATIDKGSRMSSAKAYLTDEVIARPNLDIVLNAYVTRVLIKNRKAYGVKFSRLSVNDVSYAYANSEVILSAGSIASPQILMLSGVGPAIDLLQVGVPVVKNIPGVGGNLQCHIGTGEVIFTLKKPVAFNPARRFIDPKNILNYFINGRGPLATPSGFESFGNIRTQWALYNTTWPDVAIVFLGLHVNSDGGLLYRNSINMKESYFKHFDSLNSKEGFTLLPYLLHPYSKGRISLRTNDPFRKPIIRANHFGDRRDVLALTEGIKRSIDLVAKSGVFEKFGARMFAKPNPACASKNAPFTDSYWECIMRHFSYTVYHDIGTCKMGPPSDPEAVVDNQLRVFGIQGLRVADTSIMPTLISGNTQAACYMIGEKASDLILRGGRSG